MRHDFLLLLFGVVLELSARSWIMVTPLSSTAMTQLEFVWEMTHHGHHRAISRAK